MNFLYSKALLWVAALLLGLQGLIIYADLIMETLFFDELFSFGINAALVWLIAKQRHLLKGIA